MNAAFHENNENYLGAALQWLRLLLECHAQPTPIASPALAMALSTSPILTVASPTALQPTTLRRRFWRRDNNAIAAEPIVPIPSLQLAPSAPPDDLDERLQNAANALQKAETASPRPALLVLAEQLGLSGFERDILLLCAAMELDTRIPSLCERAQDNPHQPYPTFALALALFHESQPAWDALAASGPLRFWRLLEITQPGGEPLTSSRLRADERIVNFIKGANLLDDRVAAFVTRIPAPTDESLPPSQTALVEHIVDLWPDTHSAIQLSGADAATAQLVAAHAARSLKRALFRLPAELLPNATGDIETLARLWQRESRLLPLALYLDAATLEGEAANAQAPLQRFVACCNDTILVATPASAAQLSRAGLHLEVARPAAAEQRDLWRTLLQDKAADIPNALSGQFDLDVATLRGIAQSGLSATDDEAELGRVLWEKCRQSVRPSLDNLAQRLDLKAKWSDLVLPRTERQQLQQIARQVGQRGRVYDDWGFRAKMNRGLGLSALFYGESGTGKTMAAEVIANHLRLDLYRIDLSAVVSKYIGETEKNLRRLFDEAERGGAVLFFDEADALFGKRSEVKDSHDRYANIEINYLLQRMESYGGLAILATNQKSALDPAFVRRLRFIVNFPFPAAPDRRRLWQKAFPPAIPKSNLDYERLSRLNLTGGSIHSIALNAAFGAARRKSAQITMPIILQAARAEFAKLERPINDADFRWIEPKQEQTA